MRIRIHFTVTGHDDYIDFEGDDAGDIRSQWDTYAEGKSVEDMWSEEIQPTTYHLNFKRGEGALTGFLPPSPCYPLQKGWKWLRIALRGVRGEV